MYKVVKKVHEKLLSSTTTSNYQLLYDMEHWTTADTGYLFLFDTIENVLNYFRWTGSSYIYEIYKCETENECLLPIKKIPLISVTIAHFWNHAPIDKIASFPMIQLPKGTKLFKSVKLVERVGINNLEGKWLLKNYMS